MTKTYHCKHCGSNNPWHQCTIQARLSYKRNQGAPVVSQAAREAAEECCNYWLTRTATCSADVEDMFARFEARLTATTPEPASGGELIERLRAFASTDDGYSPHVADRELVTEAADRITACQARIAVLEGALAKAHALVDCIEQRAADNLWWVNADDPETAICETFEAICSALTEGSRG